MDKEEYRKKIIEMVERVENVILLIKIFTFIKEWLEEWQKEGFYFPPSFLRNFSTKFQNNSLSGSDKFQ